MHILDSNRMNKRYWVNYIKYPYTIEDVALITP